MARRFETPRCGFRLVDGHIETDGTVRQKITGTSFGAVLGHNPYMSPFEASCRLLGLISEDISDKPAVRTGRLLEVPIIRYLDSTYEDIGRFMADEDLGFGEREGPHDEWASDFSDPVFAGHIDGIVQTDGMDCILEIKTARDPSAWTEGVPQHYLDQVALYNHFLTKSWRAFVGVGFVTEETYDDPASWTPSAENVVLIDLDIILSKTEADVRYARAWYAKYIEAGMTPDHNPDNPRDAEIWSFLQAIAAPGDEVASEVDRLAYLDAMIKAHDAEVAEARAEADDLRKRIKDHMVHNGETSIDSTSAGWVATIREQKRTRIDRELMEADGLDPDRYIKAEISNVFSIKKKE